jgi:hypothetical protein
VADQQIPPEVLAQVAAQNGGAAAPPPQEDIAAAGLEAMLIALKANATASTMNTGETGMNAGEAKDFAQATLFVAQAIITLDPTRLQGGDTPEARKAATPERPATNDADRDGRIGE